MNSDDLNIHQILQKYWGYSSFRPLQEEIIESVLEGKDTLALLPTGGGKSITFQVPALAREGLCLVISPLIALMKDQVDNLNKRGIKAAAIYSGMHQDEIDIVLNKCRFGDFKLLYLSPERLNTTKFRDALRRLKINLIAVDEAHCISQWGYDFRPPYLKIAEIRQFIPGVPILALTATAVPAVIDDIQKNLLFSKKNLFSKSFERKNLTYFVFKEEDKIRRMVKIIRKVKGCGIVYVRNRRHTKEIAEILNKQGIRSTFYHAGLDPRDREKRQNLWMKEEKNVMVSTNAFGMGIDKPNVRFVIHYDLPDSLEAYFQEAGRAGRDEKQSFAILLYETADIIDSRHNLEVTYPEIQKIRDIYNALGNYFRIPVGSGRETSVTFDISGFSEQYNFQSVIVYNALKLLEKEGFVVLSEGLHSPSKLFMKSDKESLYRFQVENPLLDPFIKAILRSYTGIFTEFSVINENELAKRTNLAANKVVELLKRLEKMQLLDYVPATDKPSITFSEDRVDARDVFLAKENYKDRISDAEKRLEAVIHFAESSHRCRSQSLLTYFGESDAKRCGKCDVCIERNKIELNELEFDTILNSIKPVLKETPCSIEQLVEAASSIQEDKVLRALQWFVDNDKIGIDKEKKYFWLEKS
jgi:ATP-dependent DNA helicase RecQ